MCFDTCQHFKNVTFFVFYNRTIFSKFSSGTIYKIYCIHLLVFCYQIKIFAMCSSFLTRCSCFFYFPWYIYLIWVLEYVKTCSYDITCNYLTTDPTISSFKIRKTCFEHFRIINLFRDLFFVQIIFPYIYLLYGNFQNMFFEF